MSDIRLLALPQLHQTGLEPFVDLFAVAVDDLTYGHQRINGKHHTDHNNSHKFQLIDVDLGSDQRNIDPEQPDSEYLHQNSLEVVETVLERFGDDDEDEVRDFEKEEAQVLPHTHSVHGGHYDNLQQRNE